MVTYADCPTTTVGLIGLNVMVGTMLVALMVIKSGEQLFADEQMTAIDWPLAVPVTFKIVPDKLTCATLGLLLEAR